MKLIVNKDFSTTRIKQGLSITGLADRMGVNPSVVSKMEKQHPVRPATAQKACKALGVPFETLFVIKED